VTILLQVTISGDHTSTRQEIHQHKQGEHSKPQGQHHKHTILLAEEHVS
jgi:hypothetical protein